MEAIGPLLVLVSIPLLLRWVPPNRFYGFRTAATFSDRALWYDANALNGRHLFGLGLVMVSLEFVLPLSIRDVTLSTVGVVGLLVVLVADIRTANRWARERDLTRRGVRR